ncbi:MFS transporter [Brevibacillus formosus]|uniref:MFS transporter n=1 Tax=Brevibacillus formosus TaxID=54913 RepID=UPI0030017F56
MLMGLNWARNKYCFMVVSFLLWFPHFIYVPVFSPYMESLGAEYTYIGIVLSSYGLMQFLCRVPIGILSDLRKVRKPFIMFGMLASMLSCVIYLLTDSLGWILVARALAGIGASSWIAFTVLYPRYFAKNELHFAMGSISFIVVLAQLLGMSASGYIVSEWGWKAPFGIGALLSVIGAVLTMFIFEPKEGMEREPITLKDLAAVVREPLLLKVSLLSILAHSIIFSTMFGFTSNYALQIGCNPSELTLLVFAFMIPHAIATLFIEKVLVPLLGEGIALKMAFFLTAAFTLSIPSIDSLGLFLVVQGLSGFSLGLIFPLLLGMAIRNIPQEKRATAMGAYQALYAIGNLCWAIFCRDVQLRAGNRSWFLFCWYIRIRCDVPYYRLGEESCRIFRNA